MIWGFVEEADIWLVLQADVFARELCILCIMTYLLWGALFIAHARQIYIFFQGSGYKNKMKDSPLNACR